MLTYFGNQSKSYLAQLVQSALNDFKSFAYEAITVDGTVQKLTVPDGAKYAIAVLESDSTIIAARILRNTSIPVSATDGLPIYAGAVLDITDYANLIGFQITEADAGATSILHVEYFK